MHEVWGGLPYLPVGIAERDTAEGCIFWVGREEVEWNRNGRSSLGLPVCNELSRAYPGG